MSTGGSFMDHTLGRRPLLGAVLGGGLGLLTGCSLMPQLPSFGGGSSIEDLLSAIDPGIWGRETGSVVDAPDPLESPLRVNVTRPRAIGELFDVPDDLSPILYDENYVREEVARITEPGALIGPPSVHGSYPIDATLNSNHFRFAPEVAVLTAHSSRQAAIWRGVEDTLIEEMEEILSVPDADGNVRYVLEDGRLVPTDAMQGLSLPPVEITQHRDELRFFQSVETPEFEGDASVFDCFEDLQEMVDVVDLPEAHVAQAQSFLWSPHGPGVGHPPFREWYFATELTSATEHTTCGVVRVDAEELDGVLSMLTEFMDGPSVKDDLVPVEMEPVSDTLLKLTLDAEPRSPDPVSSFYTAPWKRSWASILK